MESAARVFKEVKNEVHPFYRKLDLPFELPTKFYTGMLVVWMQRPNLQERFPLHLNRQEDYLYFLAWCFSIGRREFQILRDNTAWNEELNLPIKLPAMKADKWPGVYSVGMYLLGIHRSRYWRPQIEGCARHRNRTARWYFRLGVKALQLGALPQWQVQALKANSEHYDQFLVKLTYPLESKKKREEIISARPYFDEWNFFDEEEITAECSQVKYHLAPFYQRAISQYLPLKSYAINVARRALVRTINKPNFEQLCNVSHKIPVEKVDYLSTKSCSMVNKPFGINLFGYAKGELGIGEDVRTVAAALQAVDVPIGIINIPLPDSVSQQDSSVDHFLNDEQLYSINLFCMTGIEMARYITEKGLSRLNGFYNIGLWPWELERWPEPLHYCYNVVDELWGISRFVANAYREAPLPIETIPMPVDVSNIADYGRDHWRLAQSDYIFIFSFDMNSTLARKNPRAVLEAFLKAFPKKDEPVCLVLKVSHLNHKDKNWQYITEKISADHRIRVIDAELRKPEVLALYRCCDCYVSLHRSEGFGRGIAECVLLGLDVITTSYSGNLEYCERLGLECVDYSLVDLISGEYFYGDTQKWANPSIDHAATLMRKSFKRKDGCRDLGSVVSFSEINSGVQIKKILDREIVGKLKDISVA